MYSKYLMFMGLVVLLMGLPSIIDAIKKPAEEYKQINSLNPSVKFKGKYYTLDLPEEYSLISKVKNKPDTLISFISNDTVYFQFKR